MKQREPKPKRYLVAVGCTEPADPRRRCPATTPDVLTHTRYEVVTTRDPAHAQARADVLAREFRCITYGNGERSPVTVLSVAPEKYRKVTALVPRIVFGPVSAERKAQEYARWLAQRDGITLPSGLIRVEWGHHTSTWRRKNQHFWNGTREVAATERRIRAVEWGREVAVYNERKDRRRGAWLYNRFDVDVRIEIPNWDFDPPPPVEEIIEDAAIAA